MTDSGTVRLTDEDMVYLNSAARPVKQLIWAAVELGIIIILASVAMTFIETRSIGLDFQQISRYFGQGQPLFAVIVGAIPYVVLSAAKTYYGEGSVGRLVMSLLSVAASMLWIYSIAITLTTLDLYQMAGVQTDYINHFIINATPFVNIMAIISAIGAIVPIGEYIGAKGKHAEAVRKKNRTGSACEEEVPEPKETVQAEVKEEWTGTPTLEPPAGSSDTAEKDE